MKRLIISLMLITGILILFCDTSKNNFKIYSKNVEEIEKLDFNEEIEEKVKFDFVDRLLNQYSEKIIITSLIAIDEFHFLFPDTATLSIMINYGYNFEYVSTKNQGILNKLKKYFKSTDTEIALQGYKRIQSWCSLYEVFSFVFFQIKQGSFDDFNDFGEIMEKMNESKSILEKKYLMIKGQSYESLSSNQKSLFIIDLVTNISLLPPKEQVLFINKFLDFFSKH